MSVIYLAGGCFWGMEKYLASVRGVTETQVGYANGRTDQPTYEEVCHCDTGHAETVRVTYDPQLVPLGFLLELYFSAIDPVSVNRQGNDRGTQYRTGIYYVDPVDRPVIDRAVSRLQAKLSAPVAVEVEPLTNFFTAEEYHQRYLDKNPGGYCHISRERFAMAAQARVNPADYSPPDPEELTSRLTSIQYQVTQQNGTEPPFENAYNQAMQPGLYVDITTGEPLFTSSDKFISGCGWPSFSKPIDPNVLTRRTDATYGMVRTEVRSRVGDAHLGHVFEDGPKDRGGLRYCINSAALRFIPLSDMEKEGYGSLIPMVKKEIL